MARRTKGDSDQQRSLVGAARRIRLKGGAAVIRREIGEREQWQDELWAYYDSTPEMKQAVLYSGSAMAKLRLFVAATPDSDEDEALIPASAPESGIDPALAVAAGEELAGLRSNLGGQSEILRLINMNLEVAGELFLVYIAPRDQIIDDLSGKVTQEASAESWTVHSISEVSVTQAGKTLIKTDGKGRGVPLDPDQGDDLIRIWVRHPRWSNRADTAMRGVLLELRILQALSNEVLAVAQGNLTRGVFKVPTGLTLAGPTPTPSTDGQVDPLLQSLSNAFLAPAADPDDVHALDYVYVRGDKADLSTDVFGPVDIKRERDSTLSAEITTWVRRFARGINLPVEKVEGHMATTFANGEQIDQDEFDDYHEPRARGIVDALTIGYLRPNLLAREEKFDPAQIERLVVWFDATQLVRQPDVEGNADAGLENDVISAAAWRREKGFTEDDAPDALELIIRNGLRRGQLSPEVTIAMIQRLADEAGIVLPDPAALAPGATSQEAMVATAMWLQPRINALAALPSLSASRRPSPVGERLRLLDAKLLDRLMVAASDAMERALERAGNRLRTKVSSANRGLIAAVPARLVAAHLGPTLVADASGDDDLLDEAWTGLGVTYLTWVHQAQQDALRAISDVVDVDTESIAVEQRAAAAASWEWMQGELRKVALARLFDPDPSVALGEADPSIKVPVGLVRQALTRAGGAAVTGADLADGYVAAVADSPSGAVATGAEIMGALRDGGATVEGWTWTYGASRPNEFEPHVDLDGIEFRDYDDPRLANTDSFPPFPFWFAGDHVGCCCTISPTIIGPQ